MYCVWNSSGTSRTARKTFSSANAKTSTRNSRYRTSLTNPRTLKSHELHLNTVNFWTELILGSACFRTRLSSAIGDNFPAFAMLLLFLWLECMTSSRVYRLNLRRSHQRSHLRIARRLPSSRVRVLGIFRPRLLCCCNIGCKFKRARVQSHQLESMLGWKIISQRLPAR